MEHLYRHFDKEGTLLYVGVSLSAIQRLNDHKQSAHWFDLISRVEIEPFETREQVLAAERKAILAEKPKHNIKIPSEIAPKIARVRAPIEGEGAAERVAILNTVIEHYGSQRAMSVALEVSEGAVSHWIKAGRVPPGSAIKMERITEGLVNAVDLVDIEYLERETIAKSLC